MRMLLSVFLLCIPVISPRLCLADDAPRVLDPRLVIERIAQNPDIVHPVALDFDHKGRLLVVESHTHFRPANYQGPAADRIRMWQDSNGDGTLDKVSTYFEGTIATMDLAVHPDGTVYLATRNEILRLRDTNGDGTADESTRIAFLDTPGNYPHNGLAGLSFDFQGNITFGMGENLGAAYTLRGSDGKTITGGGEGGNVFTCTPEGKGLRRIATGFWNPFGSGKDIFGRTFVVDNDPDAMPPCRLLYVVEGADFGYQFRYGRSGRHPFLAWNGELPGTLPMVSGTGESPCEILAYESVGLPPEYRGQLLAPIWSDHSIERYVPQVKGAGIQAERQVLVQGGKDFRPSGMTIAPDGSLYIADWVSRSYELHGQGAIWRIRWKDAPAVARPTSPGKALLSDDRLTREQAARTLLQTPEGVAELRQAAASENARIRATALVALIANRDPGVDLDAVARKDPEPGLQALAVRTLASRGRNVSEYTADAYPAIVRVEGARSLTGPNGLATLMTWLDAEDHYLSHAAVQKLGATPNLLTAAIRQKEQSARQRQGVLLAQRITKPRNRVAVIAAALQDPDPDVRLLAAKWIADERVTELRPVVLQQLERPDLDPRGVIAWATTLARLDDLPVNDNTLQEYFVKRLRDPQATPAQKIQALRSITAAFKGVTTKELLAALKSSDAQLKIEALRFLAERADPQAQEGVRALLQTDEEPLAVRAQALLTYSVLVPDDVELFMSLTRAEPPLRNEALRALTGLNLTPIHRSNLEKLATTDARDLVWEVLKLPKAENRPKASDTAAWLALLDGPADPEAGRRVFENPKVATCSRCHRVDGRGAIIGPDLSLVGRMDRRWLVESILQPDAVLAPHYQAWTMETADGQVRTGLLVRTYLDESEYLNEQGERFKVLAQDVVSLRAASRSIMPAGLMEKLTDQDVRDLLAYLASKK